MLFEEKVVNLQLFNHKRQMSMISNSDFENLRPDPKRPKPTFGRLQMLDYDY